MFSFLKKLFGFFSPEKNEIDPNEIIEEQWIADFGAKEPRFRFTITAENVYRAYLRKLQSAGDEKEKPVLALSLLKTGCIAWTEDTLYRYRDLVIRGSIRVDPMGGYGAAGFMFRVVDENTYYMALVSNRGYFRLDLVRNGTPLALAGWTEAPGLDHTEESLSVEFELEIVAYGTRILVLVNGEWAAEINDSSLSEGRIAFCAAGYEGPDQAFRGRPGERPCVEALLSAFSLDSRIGEVSARYDEVFIAAPPENRIRLAETFSALGRANPALVQIRKAWESRLEAGTDPARLSGELLLGAKLALALELWDEAEDCIEAGLSAGDDAGEFRDLKAGLLYSRGAYRELLSWAEETRPSADTAAFYNLLGHAFFHLEKYEEAAQAYDRACGEEGEGKNGHAAKNAAGAWELLGDREKALDRYIRAGRIFLDQNRYEELALLVPKLRLFGAGNWEARALVGKWAFGIENWEEAEAELEKAEELRKAPRGPESGRAEGGAKPKPDPAVFYLQALLLIRKDRRKEALPLLEKAVKCAPDYPLFRFRLAENRFLLLEKSGVKLAAEDPALKADVEAALAIRRDEGESYGWVHNFAAQLDLNRGNLAGAEDHLEKAASVLGEVPAVLVNRAVAFYLGGKLDKALALLEGGAEDPEGLMANCAGNLLVRAGRFEEADRFYKEAIAAAPKNQQYRFNRASCLVELARYGEADAVLTSFSGGTSSPEILELIAFVAAKKGEYRRAETASRAALEINPEHAPSLLHLGWSCAAGGRWEEVERILDRLDDLELNEEMSRGKDDLDAWMEEATTRLIACASCGIEWRVRKNPEPVPPLRLYAMPPDDMPAGTCPACGNSYCVGCRKDALDEAGRFTCPECGKTLKLSDEGVKELIYIWAEENIAAEQEESTKEENPVEEPAVTAMPEAPEPVEQAASGTAGGEQIEAEPAAAVPEASEPEAAPPKPENAAPPSVKPSEPVEQAGPVVPAEPSVQPQPEDSAEQPASEPAGGEQAAPAAAEPEAPEPENAAPPSVEPSEPVEQAGPAVPAEPEPKLDP
ncbi:MAG: tetratricopeptide repeat protein [Treponema sp.]|jgi:tetratricopeptide (TPR) repeat protein/transcription elongation factor Elf1|nr:tetratricopeptide repeat protein [Treponema sp.]